MWYSSISSSSSSSLEKKRLLLMKVSGKRRDRKKERNQGLIQPESSSSTINTAVSSMEIAQPKQAAAAAAPITVLKATDLTFAKCECCGLTEECTEEYIKRVRERFSGRWICGLCAEAVKDEVVRSEKKIGNEEALNQHMSFCRKFKNLSPPPKSPSDELISAVKQLLLKSLDSPRSSPVKKRCLLATESCFSALDS